MSNVYNVDIYFAKPLESNGMPENFDHNNKNRNP